MSKLVGRQIESSDKITSLIQQLIGEVTKLEADLTTSRPSQPDLADAAKLKYDAVAKARGRPLLYPFLGTGAGHGPYVEVEDGSVKLDFINGIGVNFFGHGHPRIREASIRGALSDVVMQGNIEPSAEYARLCEKLAELAAKKSRLKYVWLTTCGTMANENALKMSRQKNTPAKLIVGMKNAFAGRSTMMAELTDNVAYKQGLPDYNEVLRIPFYDPKDPRSTETTVRAFKEHVAANPGKIACLCFEPMLGEGGYVAAPREFFIPLLEFAREQKIAIWADEVQTFMRTGELFAFETLNIGEYIDICTVAKTLQCAATLFTEEFNPKPGLVAGTFSGGSAAMAAGLESLKIVTEGDYFGANGKINQIHKEFVGILNRLNETTCKGLLKDAGGLGTMIAVTPLDGKSETVSKLLQKMYANGMVAYSCGKDPVRLRFLVPAVVTSKDLELAGKIIEKSILETAPEKVSG